MPKRPPIARLLPAAALATLAACGLIDQLQDKVDGGGGSEPVAAPRPSPDRGHQPRGLTAEPEASRSTGLAPAVHVDADKLVDDAGQQVHLHGFSWFGFNDRTDALGGLWSNEGLADFANTVWRQKLLGFNAVRLPFSFARFSAEPKKIVHACADISDDDLVRSALGPDDQGVDVSKAPKLPLPPKREPGQCNGYIGGTTVRDQLLWTTRFFVDQGFYVLLDNHYREDPTVEQDQKAWERAWADLAHAVLSQPDLAGRVFFDLLNEPDEHGQRWEGDKKVGIKTLYLAAMDAIDQQSDRAIYFLEGTGHSSLRANWGDGYATDADTIRTLGVSDVRPFFDELSTKPYAKRVVLAPHVYGPAVTYAPADFAGQGLFNRLSKSFGHLTSDGFDAKGGKIVFPVAIGEWGSKFEQDGDKAFMADFASYLKNEGPGADGQHNAIGSWFYWCWGANSGDTGGLVKDDWTSLQWEKLKYLQGLGLTPWHKRTDPPAPVAAPTPKPASSSAPAQPTQASAPPATPKPASAAGQANSKPSVQYEKIDLGSFATPAAKPAPDAAAPATPSPVAEKDGKVHYAVGYNGQWEENGKTHFVYNIHLTNTSDKAIEVPFDLEIVGPVLVDISEAWNLSDTKVDGDKLRARVTASWAALPPDGGGTTNVGYIGISEAVRGELKGLKVAGQDAVLDN